MVGSTADIARNQRLCCKMCSNTGKWRSFSFFKCCCALHQQRALTSVSPFVGQVRVSYWVDVVACFGLSLKKYVFRQLPMSITNIFTFSDWKQHVSHSSPLLRKLGWRGSRALWAHRVLGGSQQGQSRKGQVGFYYFHQKFPIFQWHSSRKFQITEIKLHEDFNHTSRLNDIALLKTSEYS